MSTKIQGYIFDKNYSLKGILRWCKQSKKIFMKELYKRAQEDYINVATDILDRCHYMSKEQIDKYIKARYLLNDLSYGLDIDTISEIAKKYEEKKERFYIQYDYKLECSILVSKNHVLIRFCGNDFGILPKYEDENENESKLIEGKIKNIRPFDYFDNVGYPLDTTEFKRRGEIWEEALPSNNFGIDGLCYTFTSADELNFFIEHKKLVSKISYEERIQKHTELIIDKVFDKQNKSGLDRNELEKKVRKFLKTKLPKSYNDILNKPISFNCTNYKYILK